MAVQAHQPQQYSENLVGLSLCGSQDWMENNGGFLDFYQQQLPQLPQQQQQGVMLQNQWRNQNQCLGQVVDPSDNLSSMRFCQPSLLAAQVEKQRQELDRFIALQNERLRSALQEQRKQQLAVLLAKLESKALNLLRQKDEDIAKATRKAMELEDCIRKVEMENQAWQRIAKENESMAIALNNTLEQVRENVCMFSSGAEDAESCCQSPHEEEEADQTKKMVCKACNSRNSCVLFLPCRHLCSCKACEAFLSACPVCKSVKKACIEVFMA